MTDAELARRYPWSQYPRDTRPQFMDMAQGTQWAKDTCPFTVRWTVPDPTPGLYGWRCESRSFLTESEALTAAGASMGIARDVEALRWNWDVAPRHPERAVRIYHRKNANIGNRKAA